MISFAQLHKEGKDINRTDDAKLIVRAKITGAATKNGKPVYPGEVLKNLCLD